MLKMARYRCGKCWKEFDDTQLKALPGVRCPYCGYKVIFMVRKPTIKVVKAI
ncbi:DNA-directed RNA polymerase subunit P [Stygiolobus caldivivus]|uniref:DNA-directed RNA polymerase subunit Rpo12 n=1 Tax=Stygiolobus caldivivus TaxID=2824673 RepID=A0A8D5U889_9CREN|nr:DNA-directed RNA polymerase subunit P [Stygiolobus caldivivus]